jgi:hypothetical protein
MVRISDNVCSESGMTLIQFCVQVLNAQERRRLAIKFLRAANWNKELGLYASRFVKRREELLFALSMRTVNTTEEIKAESVFIH